MTQDQQFDLIERLKRAEAERGSHKLIAASLMQQRDEARAEKTALAIDAARVAVARDKAIARAEAAELALAEVDMVLGVVGADRECRRLMLCTNRDRTKGLVADIKELTNERDRLKAYIAGDEETFDEYFVSRPDAWQPIDTAPHNHRVLVRYVPTGYDATVAIACRRNTSDGGTAWLTSSGRALHDDKAPTHWRFLPSAEVA